MTSVDLHSREDHAYSERDIARELKVLLECRHPYILLMLGVCVDYAEGTVFIMERAWGPVTRALQSGPLPVQPAIAIATQISSAVLYLHDRGICHGQVGKHSAFLLFAEWEGPVTAKLANFTHAKLLVDDYKPLVDDITSFGVFLYDLFAKNSSGNAVPDQLSQLSREDLQRNVSLAEIGILLESIFQDDVTSAIEIVEWFVEMRRRFEEVGEHAVAISQSAEDLHTSISNHYWHRNAQPAERPVAPYRWLLSQFCGAAVSSETRNPYAQSLESALTETDPSQLT